MNWEVIFYKNGKGRRPAEEFLETLTDTERKSFDTRINYVELKGLSVKKDVMTDVEGVRNLYRLRVKSKNNPRLLLCTVSGRTLYVLHGFKEKSKSDYKAAVRKAIPRRDAVERFHRQND